MKDKRDFVRERTSEDSSYVAAKVVNIIIIIISIIILFANLAKFEELVDIFAYAIDRSELTGSFLISILVLLLLGSISRGLSQYIACQKAAYEKEHEIRSYYDYKERSRLGWVCECCNTSNDRDGDYCKKCGAKKGTKREIHAHVPEAPKGWLCACGANNVADASFCHNCGNKKEQVAVSAVSKPPVSYVSSDGKGWVCECGTYNTVGIFCSNCKKKIPVHYNPSKEWLCPTCGRINQNYVSTCGCGYTRH